MYLVTVAPATPAEKPLRVVCKDITELVAEVEILSGSSSTPSFLVERVTSYVEYGDK